MRNIISTLLMLINIVNLFAQKNEYQSKEIDEYYKNRRALYSPFKPVDTEYILNFTPKYYEIKECSDGKKKEVLIDFETNKVHIQKEELCYEPYSPEKDSEPYSDSIFSKMSFHEYIIQDKQIGRVDEIQFLKFGKKDSIEAFIYQSPIFEYNEPGIWIGYSENNGKNWAYYYTGIVQRQPVFLKSYSQKPLIKEKGKLEIEACLLKQIFPYYNYQDPFPYECVKDGIYVTFDIDVISKDSDNDGLTDIVEEKLYTNKFDKDTDGDGIPDNIDVNPRKHYPKTEKTKIYEAYLNNQIDWEYNIGRLSLKDSIGYATDLTETVLIITDDEDLLAIEPQNYRVIFMTTNEYLEIQKDFNTGLNKIDISPLFKVKNKKNTYLMNHDADMCSASYLIRKRKKDWIIQFLSMVVE